MVLVRNLSLFSDWSIILILRVPFDWFWSFSVSFEPIVWRFCTVYIPSIFRDNGRKLTLVTLVFFVSFDYRICVVRSFKNGIISGFYWFVAIWSSILYSFWFGKWSCLYFCRRLIWLTLSIEIPFHDDFKVGLSFLFPWTSWIPLKNVQTYKHRGYSKL